jgi:hypothetical protein
VIINKTHDNYSRPYFVKIQETTDGMYNVRVSKRMEDIEEDARFMNRNKDKDYEESL